MYNNNKIEKNEENVCIEIPSDLNYIYTYKNKHNRNIKKQNNTYSKSYKMSSSHIRCNNNPALNEYIRSISPNNIYTQIHHMVKENKNYKKNMSESSVYYIKNNENNVNEEARKKCIKKQEKIIQRNTSQSLCYNIETDDNISYIQNIQNEDNIMYNEEKKVKQNIYYSNSNIKNENIDHNMSPSSHVYVLPCDEYIYQPDNVMNLHAKKYEKK